MSDETPRFNLPYILPGQAQKEQFHNEALVIADALLHPAVEDGPLATPPASPLPGQCWLVGTGASGAWTGHVGRLAAWTESGWRFIAPAVGTQVWSKSSGYHLRWSGSAWVPGDVTGTKLSIGGVQVVGSRQPAVPSPSGGTTIDVEARASIGSIIVALKSHGLID